MKTAYLCPVCREPLTAANGDATDPANGITLYCGNLKCSAQEVAGHGNRQQDAYKVIEEKFKSHL